MKYIVVNFSGNRACAIALVRVYYTRKNKLVIYLKKTVRVAPVFSDENARIRRKEESMGLLIFLFWITLNGRLTWETAGLGAAVTGAAFVFLCKSCDWSLKKEIRLYAALPLIADYVFTVIWEIVKANLAMFRVIYGGKPEPMVRTIHTELRTRLGRMALSNAITLTPGTITLSCDGDRLTVHCLTPALAQGLDHLIFEKKLKRIEAAFHG